MYCCCYVNTNSQFGGGVFLVFAPDLKWAGRHQNSQIVKSARATDVLLNQRTVINVV